MISWLHSPDYLIWAGFILLEIVLFFALRDSEHQSIRWFMAFAFLRDLVLLNFVFSLWWYARLFWAAEMVELVWFAYIAGHLCNVLMPQRWTLATILPALTVLFLCCLNFPPQHTKDMLSLVCHCSLISATVLFVGIVFRLVGHHLRISWAILGLILTGIGSAAAWRLMVSLPWTRGVLWTMGLIAVGLSLKRPRNSSVRSVLAQAHYV